MRGAPLASALSALLLTGAVWTLLLARRARCAGARRRRDACRCRRALALVACCRRGPALRARTSLPRSSPARPGSRAFPPGSAASRRRGAPSVSRRGALAPPATGALRTRLRLGCSARPSRSSSTASALLPALRARCGDPARRRCSRAALRASPRDPWLVLAAFGVGLVLGAAFLATGSVALCAAAHAGAEPRGLRAGCAPAASPPLPLWASAPSRRRSSAPSPGRARRRGPRARRPAGTAPPASPPSPSICSPPAARSRRGGARRPPLRRRGERSATGTSSGRASRGAARADWSGALRSACLLLAGANAVLLGGLALERWPALVLVLLGVSLWHVVENDLALADAYAREQRPGPLPRGLDAQLGCAGVTLLGVGLARRRARAGGARPAPRGEPPRGGEPPALRGRGDDGRPRAARPRPPPRPRATLVASGVALAAAGRPAPRLRRRLRRVDLAPSGVVAAAPRGPRAGGRTAGSGAGPLPRAPRAPRASDPGGAAPRAAAGSLRAAAPLRSLLLSPALYLLFSALHVAQTALARGADSSRPVSAALGQALAFSAAFWLAFALAQRASGGAFPVRIALSLVLGAAAAHLGWAALHPAVLRTSPAALLDPSRGFCVLFVPLGALAAAPRGRAGGRERFLAAVLGALPLSLAVARLGCLAAGCCLGAARSCPGRSAMPREPLRHPVAVYDAAGCAALQLALRRAAEGRPRRRGPGRARRAPPRPPAAPRPAAPRRSRPRPPLARGAVDRLRGRGCAADGETPPRSALHVARAPAPP